MKVSVRPAVAERQLRLVANPHHRLQLVPAAAITPSGISPPPSLAA